MPIREISRAEDELSALLAEVRKGNEVIVPRAGKPVAKIVPYGVSRRRRKPGSMTGEIRISPDFDSLPDEVSSAFGMNEPRRVR